MEVNTRKWLPTASNTAYNKWYDFVISSIVTFTSIYPQGEIEAEEGGDNTNQSKEHNPKGDKKFGIPC
ncbi:hypothetical protein H5410_026579 [Solanum commersonii]|uniref:Uncharacterized protein n=1 Tax=Solanum commersonii TaxID=4109 RepID=A0A9J5YZE8_SOLCO|nr:hypothetical protein H5410_026579 [Solanum commersonii]